MKTPLNFVIFGFVCLLSSAAFSSWDFMEGYPDIEAYVKKYNTGQKSQDYVDPVQFTLDKNELARKYQGRSPELAQAIKDSDFPNILLKKSELQNKEFIDHMLPNEKALYNSFEADPETLRLQGKFDKLSERLINGSYDEKEDALSVYIKLMETQQSISKHLKTFVETHRFDWFTNRVVEK